MPASKPHERVASIVFFDPGETTGVAVLSVSPRWLEGHGDADWHGLKRAIKGSWLAQIGADAREWDGKRAIEMHDPLKTPERLFSGTPVHELVAHELNMIYEAREILDNWSTAAWGYEDYIPESMAAAQKGALTPMRFFSTLAFYTIMDDARPRVPFVQSRTMKSSADNERMKLAGLYLPGMPHATDAARHACVFLRAARQKEAVRKLAWPQLFDAQIARTG